jgi:hypothetical protein
VLVNTFCYHCDEVNPGVAIFGDQMLQPLTEAALRVDVYHLKKIGLIVLQGRGHGAS